MQPSIYKYIDLSVVDPDNLPAVPVLVNIRNN